MIDAKIKEAWRIANQFARPSLLGTLCDAYLQAEAMREKAEWFIAHGSPRVTYGPYIIREWTDADWLAEKRRELEGS